MINVVPPKISIIIPVYNAEKYLRQCLDSVVNQTLKEIEILCINDGSTDSSLDILNEYAEQDKRIKVFSQKNSGPATARNVGLDNASAPYVTFCDSDDFYIPEALQTMLDAFMSHNVDLVMCDCNIIIDEEKHGRPACDLNYYRQHLAGFHRLDENTFNLLNVLLWNKLFKRELINNYKIRFPDGLEHDDTAFFDQYFMVSKTYFGLDNKLYNYVVHQGSIMSTLFSKKKKDKIYDCILSVETTLKFLNRHNLLEQKSQLMQKRLGDAVGCLKFLLSPDENKKMCLKHLKRIINQFPSNTSFTPLFEAIHKKQYSLASNLLNNFLYNTSQKKYLFGLIKKVKTENKIIYKLCGVKIFTKTRKNTKIKYASIKKIKKEIKRHDIISFDIFDTLIMRPYMQPEDVFKHLEKIFNTNGFYDLRKNAEKKAQQSFQIQHINFDEIYKILPSKFQFLKQKEFNLEKKTLFSNPEMKKLFDWTVKQKKKIILTSDMYFSEKQLTDILKKCGYTTYNKIYISATYRKAKYTKELYTYITKELKVKTSQILHIGDNFNSDYICARGANWKALLYKTPKLQFFEKNKALHIFFKEHQDSLTSSLIFGILLKKFTENNFKFSSYWEKFGYIWGGPICYGISKYLQNEIQKRSLKEVIFVARDGYTIEKIFKLLSPKIQTHYIYAPRIINLATSLNYSNDLPWTNKLTSLIRIYKELSPEFAIKCNNIKSRNEQIACINENKKILKQIAEKMFETYRKYIKDQNIKEKRLGLFDISGGGFNSLKLCLKVLPEKIITAFYWLVVGSEAKKFDVHAFQTSFSKTFINYNLLEFIITAPELPIKYIDSTGDFIRVYNKYEKYRKNAYNIVSQAEIEFSQDILKTFGKYETSFLYEDLIDYINTFIQYPSSKDLSEFSNIKHGIDEYHSVYKKILKKRYHNKIFLFLNYYRCKILQNLSSGAKKKHYQYKKREIKNLIK